MCAHSVVWGSMLQEKLKKCNVSVTIHARGPPLSCAGDCRKMVTHALITSFVLPEGELDGGGEECGQHSVKEEPGDEGLESVEDTIPFGPSETSIGATLESPDTLALQWIHDAREKWRQYKDLLTSSWTCSRRVSACVLLFLVKNIMLPCLTTLLECMIHHTLNVRPSTRLPVFFGFAADSRQYSPPLYLTTLLFPSGKSLDLDLQLVEDLLGTACEEVFVLGHAANAYLLLFQ